MSNAAQRFKKHNIVLDNPYRNLDDLEADRTEGGNSSIMRHLQQ